MVQRRQRQAMESTLSYISEAKGPARRQRSLDGLALIRHSIQLLKFVQQHRAICLGAQGGSKHFRASLPRTQQEIENFLNAIHQAPSFREITSWRVIITEWHLIKTHWDDYSSIDNFELHNFLIDRILILIRDVAKKADLFTLSKHHFHLSDFCFNHLMRYIETLGKLRGLSVYASSPECKNELVSSRLRHLHKICVDGHEDHLRLIGTLPEKLQALIAEYYKQDAASILTRKCLYLIERELLSDKPCTVSSEKVFLAATRPIEIELSSLVSSVALLESGEF